MAKKVKKNYTNPNLELSKSLTDNTKTPLVKGNQTLTGGGYYNPKNTSFGVEVLKWADPTGISNWGDLYESTKPGSERQLGVEILASLPVIGKVGKTVKALDAVITGTKTSLPLFRMGREIGVLNSTGQSFKENSMLNTKNNIPQYGFGGWLKENAGVIGSVVGGTIGLLGGPAGVAAGASIGGALGGSIQANDAEAQANAEIQKQNQELMVAQSKALSKPLSSSQMYGVYKLGGSLDIPNPIINIEEGELAIKRPQENSRAGKIVKEFKGVNPLTNDKYKPHADKANKEPVSNYVPRSMVKGELEADYIISKKYAQPYKDATKRRDQFTINSIIRNIDAESEMGTDVRNKQMKMGGPIPKYYLGGGIDLRGLRVGFDPYLEGSPFFKKAMENLSGLPSYSPISRIAPQETMQTMTMRQPNLGVVTPGLKGGTTVKPDVYSAPTTDMDPLTKNAMLAAVPGLINLGRGLFEKPTKVDRVNPIFNPYEGAGLAKFSNRISAQPALNEMNTQRNTGIQGLRGVTNNASVLRSNLQGLYSGTQRNAGNIINDTRLKNLGLDAQEGQAILGAGANRQSAMMQAQGQNLQIDEMNRANRAAKSNLIAQGLADIPKQMLQLNQNQEARDMDAFRTMLLMDTFGTSADLYNQPKYQKYLRRLRLKD